MRIRQIELVGFKSFREPTRLALCPGINAVVGPNGCGKSNVSDAVRWALGEQSVKHLRAREMEDVIFCGNASSPALNFAEVSITFEQDGEGLAFAGEAEGLAAHVARQHEFTIARRIFRSGESQYFINQAPARLRDITELFLGSGVGPKAYAMIEQGRVGQIVAAKPEELRLYIEEAAGTTRFRSRKLAAERKLERTNENLARVNDVMREIERQLATLRRQAKRAEEYRLLEAELHRTEIALAGARFRLLVDERDAAASELEEAQAVAGALQSEVESAEAGRSAAAEREQAAAQQIEVAFAAVAEVSGAVVRATERQVAARDAAAGLESRLTRALEEVADLEARTESAAQAVRDSESERVAREEAERNEVLALETADREVGALAPAFESAQVQQAGAMAALNEARRRSAGAAASRTERAARLQGLVEERQRIAARRDERATEAAAAEGRLREARRAKEQAQVGHDRLAESRRAATHELRERELEQERLEENLSAAREVLVHRRGRLEGLRERERSLDGYAEGMAVVLAHDPPPRGLVLDGMSIPPELEAAVAAVLGDAVRGAVVQSLDEAADIARVLHRTGAGRVPLLSAQPGDHVPPPHDLPAGVVSLASLIGATPGCEAIRSALFEGVALADDLTAALAAWRASGGASVIVTRAGDLLDRRGVLTGGRAPESTDLLQRRREVGELGAQIAEDEVRQTAIEQRLAEVRDEAIAAGAELQRLDAEAHAATLELVAAEHALGTAERDLSTAHRRLVEAESEIADCSRAMADSEAALAQAEAGLSEASAAEQGATALLAASDAELARRRGELDDARARRDVRRQALSSAREALTRALAELGQRQHERAVMAARREGLDGEATSLRREREATLSLLASLEEELVAGRAELARREEAVERARESARAIQVELRDYEAQLSRARGEHEQARRRCQEIELRLAQHRAQIDALCSFAREQHGIDPASAEVPEDFDESGAAERIQEIRDRIARLGDVNVAAIADARELEERFSFLEGQRRDLETSIEDLRRTITELSRTTRARFRETFELANEKFQSFFAELFRGGSATLKLTHPQNLLETGVEMEVQPPGKSLRTLESLSGGEKALTAISLLMALFSLRATPFCVLDEVDAPLDEANLGRFNGMLQRMSERTQFIVITHHQLTMESADTLYGVTMPEAGVSQLVSVELPAREDSPGHGNGDGDALALAAYA